MDVCRFRIEWPKAPSKVLIIKKLYTKDDDPDVIRMVKYLTEKYGVTVYLEKEVMEDFSMENTKSFVCEDLKHIDFIVTFGGDGTVLHANSLFKGKVPPILSINTGSIGFLCPYTVDEMKEAVDLLMKGQVCESRRMRLQCEIKRSDGTVDSQFHVLNDVVVDRGPSPFLCTLECYCAGVHMTTVQADGLIVSTPTGSTAYSMSAGGSIVHPYVSCILLTPICPHTLSFRPVILPEDGDLVIKVPDEARSSSWVSLDGRSRIELKRGDSLVCKTSCFPLTMVNKASETKLWFESITEVFNWNKRKAQKSFVKKSEAEDQQGKVDM